MPQIVQSLQKNSIHFQEKMQCFAARHLVSMAAIVLRDDGKPGLSDEPGLRSFGLRLCFEIGAHFTGTDENGEITLGALMEYESVQTPCSVQGMAGNTPKRISRIDIERADADQKKKTQRRKQMHEGQTSGENRKREHPSH